MPASPILLLVPYRNKAAVLYSQIPTSASASGDMVVSRAGVSTRINAQGNIESVAANVPRLNYPLGGVANGCPALLVEPSAQNLALQSENFGTTWNPTNMLAFGSGSVLNTTATLDPYGTNVADFIVGNTTVGQHRFDQTTTSVSGSYTLSVFVKAGGYSFTKLRIGLAGAIFDLSSGVVVATDAGITSSIQSFGNGWFRCIIGKAASAANEIIRINMQPTSSTVDFAGDGTSGIYVFGAQYETGSVATSYIPTTTGTVTRNADIVTNNTFVIPNLIGAILTEFDSPTSGTYFLDNIPIPIASGSNKIAISYTPTTLTIYRNGAQVSGSPVTPPGGTAPVIGNVINIGHNNQLYQLGSGIKSFVLYSSTLSAAEASGLTT